MKAIKLFCMMAAAMLVACAPKNEGAVKEKSFMDLARARFAVREYSQQPVEQAKIDSILEAGRLAPTAKNIQPQHVYVLQSEEAIAKINELTRCAYHAPVVFLVCYDTTLVWTKDGENSGNMDCSIVGTQMMLEATELGLGTCWVKWFDAAEVAAAFELPANHKPAFIMPCGYAAEGVQPHANHFSRKPLSETVTYK